MGYGLFASRKLYYCDMINNINIQLDNIAQEKQRLLTLTANIADGKITPDEFASDPSNTNNYLSFMAGSDAYKNSPEGGGDVSNVISGFMTEREYSEEDAAAIAKLLDESLGTEYAKAQSKKLTAAESQLELQQKRLETRLTVAQKQLEAVEQAEARAIQNAVPKYSGLG